MSSIVSGLDEREEIEGKEENILNRSIGVLTSSITPLKKREKRSKSSFISNCIL